MKLKLVVASMSVLGLISCPVFAATTTAKHKHHVAKRHSVADYKGMGALPMQPVSIVEACPLTDMYTMTLDSMSQNLGRAKPTEDCNKLITFAGGLNIDGKWGNRSMGYQGENNKRISINDGYLNVNGNVSEWAKAFISLSYNDASDHSTSYRKNGAYSDAYDANNFNLEQGFIRLADFNSSPVFVQVGKQFQDYGRYTIHPLTRTLAQVLTESLQTSAGVGFVTRMGLHGSAYAFENSAKKSTNTHTATNYGASLGFDQPSDTLGFGVGAGYMYDMTGANDIAYNLQNYSTGYMDNGGYQNRVSGLALYADVNSGPFSLGGRYTTALQSFSAVDLNAASPSVRGAKPWAGDLKAGYGFNAWNKNQNVYLGYQASGDAVELFLPKNRWLAGYSVDMWRMTTIGVEFNHDTDYSVADLGTGNSSNTLGVRASVKFG